MPNPHIEEFARLLIEQVRDCAIETCDRALHPEAPSALASRWREAARKGDLDLLVRTVIPDVVDETIFELLRAIDDKGLKLTFTASNGKASYLPVDGRSELAGCFFGSGGWRAMHSKQRFVDDFSDLV